jgi:hypothetical protein
VLKETNKTHNWLVYSMGLLLRSRLEAEKSRTVERGVLQMQAWAWAWAPRGVAWVSPSASSVLAATGLAAGLD